MKKKCLIRHIPSRKKYFALSYSKNFIKVRSVDNPKNEGQIHAIVRCQWEVVEPSNECPKECFFYQEDEMEFSK